MHHCRSHIRPGKQCLGFGHTHVDTTVADWRAKAVVPVGAMNPKVTTEVHGPWHIRGVVISTYHARLGKLGIDVERACNRRIARFPCANLGDKNRDIALPSSKRLCGESDRNPMAPLWYALPQRRQQAVRIQDVGAAYSRTRPGNRCGLGLHRSWVCPEVIGAIPIRTFPSSVAHPVLPLSP